MKRTMAFLTSLVCVSGLAGAVHAQVPGVPGTQIGGGPVGSQMMRDKNMPDDARVIGCIGQSADMSHFVLNNVKVVDPKANSPMKDEATMKKDDSRPKSYMLMSTEDMKAHVGHQVELTGAIVANTSGVIHGEVKGQMPQELPRQDSASAKADVPTFAVKSVKMIASACS